MLVTEQMFRETVTKWADDVRKEALALFASGADHDQCLPLAIQIVNARDVKRARALQAMMPSGPLSRV